MFLSYLLLVWTSFCFNYLNDSRTWKLFQLPGLGRELIWEYAFTGKIGHVCADSEGNVKVFPWVSIMTSVQSWKDDNAKLENRRY